ncbi:non-heme iron oxygenase ferredoxin subunit [bacterium]|nr:non-heme iron oxygenase ferredoxin subunit [bacterium]MBU1984977.1 non-heme iron oxygenase ferredoxin subunit [bacterium]
MSDSEFIRVCSVSDVPEGEARAFKRDGIEIAIVRSEGKFYAIHNVCSHEHEHLHEGWIEGEQIECPRHGAQFDLKTGKALSLPATNAISVYEVKIEGEDVLVAMRDEG